MRQPTASVVRVRSRQRGLTGVCVCVLAVQRVFVRFKRIFCRVGAIVPKRNLDALRAILAEKFAYIIFF